MLKLTIEELKEQMPEMNVRIVSLCNEEKFYKPGDTGIVKFVDDAGQVHVSWNHGGSIALLPLEGDTYDCWISNDVVLKKVKENFKKKRGRWQIQVGMYECITGAYDGSLELFKFLDSQFNEEEKEKYMYNKVKIGTTPNKDAYVATITFQR